MDLRAEEVAVGGLLREEEEVEAVEEFGSKTASRSQRHEGQKPVKCSSG